MIHQVHFSGLKVRVSWHAQSYGNRKLHKVLQKREFIEFGKSRSGVVKSIANQTASRAKQLR